MSVDAPRLAFRCDGGAEIGLGHVAGCLRLAKLLTREAGINAHFVVRHDPSVISLVKKAGYDLDVIPVETTPEEDFAGLVRLAGGRGWQGVVTNFCKADLERYAGHFATLKNAGLKLIFMDHPIPPSCWLADVLINSLPHPEYAGYDPANHPACFDGLEHLVLDPAHRQLQAKPRVHNDLVERVLISMGGGDAANSTRLVLEGLQAAAFRGYVDVVLGAANPHEPSIRDFFQASGLAGEITRNCDDLPERILQADLGFSALGLTTYEMAALRLPVLILAGTPFNAGVAEAYAGHYRAAVFIGEAMAVSSGAIADSFNSLSRNRTERERLGEAGRRVGSEAAAVLLAVMNALSPDEVRDYALQKREH